MAKKVICKSNNQNL